MHISDRNKLARTVQEMDLDELLIHAETLGWDEADYYAECCYSQEDECWYHPEDSSTYDHAREYIINNT